VLRGICPSLDEEAQRVINSTSGRWVCGKVDGKPVKTYKYVKINFKIDTMSDQSAAIAKPVQPISFIGGDEAFYNFIRSNIEVPVGVYLHPNLWGNVRASMTFNSLNEITDVTLIEGPFKDLNEEGVRLLKLSQGKWLRTDSGKMSRPVSIIVDIPFNQTMIDTNNRNKIFTDRFVHIAYVSNPVFKRGFDNFQSVNYDMAIQDFEECIHKKENTEAALYGRALCYLKKHNLAAACEDLSILKSDNPDKGNYFVEMYYKYCSQPDRSNQKLRTPAKPQNLQPKLK
jgi:tetratricopeptide (TPR) repeat protein